MINIGSVKKVYLLFGLAVLSAILHNLFYAIFKMEEGIFFILTLVFFFGFWAYLIAVVFRYLRSGQPKDIWKLGWFGLLGLYGFSSDFNHGFAIFLVFTLFFLAKHQKQ